jgi:hypothetical protein
VRLTRAPQNRRGPQRRRAAGAAIVSDAAAALAGIIAFLVATKPRPIPPDELRAMSEHVLYEIEMFSYTTDLLTPELWQGVPAFMATGAHNALIESFTIHVRALRDFLYAEPRGDDASAADYFPEGVWSAIRLPEPDVLRDARRRTGKEIAHLTYARLDGEADGKLWPHREIVDALRSALFRFIDRVDRELVCKGFWARGWNSIQTAASVPERARSGEPGTVLAVATQSFGMPS